MADYESMDKPVLVELAKQRGLPTGGTKTDLMKRLTKADTPADAPAAAEPADVQPDPEPAPDPEPVQQGSDRPITGLTPDGYWHEGQRKSYRMQFPAPGDGPIPDDEHFAYIARTRAAAVDSGHAPKGGETIGSRVGFSTDADGNRTVVYEIPLKRSR